MRTVTPPGVTPLTVTVLSMDGAAMSVAVTRRVATQLSDAPAASVSP